MTRFTRAWRARKPA